MSWISAAPSRPRITEEQIDAHAALENLAGATLNSNLSFTQLPPEDLAAAIDAVYLKHQTAFETSQCSLDEVHGIITETRASGGGNLRVMWAIMDRLLKYRVQEEVTP